MISVSSIIDFLKINKYDFIEEIADYSRTISGFIDSFPLNQQVAISNMIDDGNINISCKF